MRRPGARAAMEAHLAAGRAALDAVGGCDLVAGYVGRLFAGRKAAA